MHWRLAWIVLATLSAAEPQLIAKWTFDDGQSAANSVEGSPAGRVERALAAEGRSSKALAFEDWSIKNYLKPDPSQASRVVVPHDARLNPPQPFTVTAWIYPTADPVYYGGIVEKGRGYGSSYRLLLLRGLKVEATFGNGHHVVRSSSSLSLNAWHEVALAAGHGTLALHVDGKLVAKTSLPDSAKTASAEPLVIGERFTGRVDEVAVTRE